MKLSFRMFSLTLFLIIVAQFMESCVMDRCLQQTDDLMFAVILVMTRVYIQMIFDTQL